MKKIIKDTDGNIITERPVGEIEIIRPPFKCIIKRCGQEDPAKGNHVIVECVPSILENSNISNFKSNLWKFKSLNTHYKLTIRFGHSPIRVEHKFLGDTWYEAFKQAEIYFHEGCDEYERLLFERDQALKNAERM